MLNKKEFSNDYCWIDVLISTTYKIIAKDEEEGAVKEFYSSEGDSLKDDSFAHNSNPFSSISKEALNETDPFLVSTMFNLTNSLNRIESKLDKLLNEKEGELACELVSSVSNGTCIRLSGNGMVMEGGEDIKRGDLLKINLLLPLYPPIPLTIISKVLKGIKIETEGSLNKKCSALLKFISIFEEDRDEIFRYVTDKQREIIRNRR